MNRPSAVSRDNDVWGIRGSFIQTCLESKTVGCLPMLTSPKQSQQRQERIVCEEDSLEYLPRRLKPLGVIDIPLRLVSFDWCILSCLALFQLFKEDIHVSKVDVLPLNGAEGHWVRTR